MNHPTQQLPPSIRALTQSDGAGRAVVFDADGTLWRGDVGEDLLRFLSAEGHLPGTGHFATYDALHQSDPPAAYAYGAAVMAGMELKAVSSLCTDFFARRFVGRVFPFVRPLLGALRRQGFVIWVCSASPRCIVEVGAAHLGVSPAQVIAVTPELEQGRVTARIVQPVPCGPGKVAWLERHGLQPALAVGNGDLDVDMLRFAQAALVIAPPDAPPSALTREATQRGWPILRV